MTYQALAIDLDGTLLVGEELPEATSGGYRVPLLNGELRFVADQDGRGPGLAGVDLTVRQKSVIMEGAKSIETPRGDCIELCGTRFYLDELTS